MKKEVEVEEIKVEEIKQERIEEEEIKEQMIFQNPFNEQHDFNKYILHNGTKRNQSPLLQLLEANIKDEIYDWQQFSIE